MTAEEVVRICERHDVTIVTILPSVDETHRFVVDKNGVEHAVFEGSEEFIDRARRVAAWMRTRPASSQEDDARPGKALEWLGERLIPRTSSHALWYAGLDTLGDVPIEVLPVTDGEPLGLAMPVVRTPSLHGAHRLSAAATGKGKLDRRNGLLFTARADSSEPDDEAIKLVSSESVNFARRSGFRADVLSKNVSTLDGFSRAMASGLDLFAVWSHGEYQRGFMVPSTLRLARDVQLDATAIEEALLEQAPELRPRLMYLAACQAARGPLRRGDSAASDLGGIALGTGVQAVIVSPEKNDRDATFEHLCAFTEAFLHDGLTAQDAILMARRSVATAEKGRWAHPHFWGGLHLVGWGAARAQGR